MNKRKIMRLNLLIFEFIGSNKGDANNATTENSNFDNEMTPVDDGDMPF